RLSKDDREGKGTDGKNETGFASVSHNAWVSRGNRDFSLCRIQFLFPGSDRNAVERAKRGERDDRDRESRCGWNLWEQRHDRSGGEQNSDGQFLCGQRAPDQT